jgi:outer membrane cobalamin receptor
MSTFFSRARLRRIPFILFLFLLISIPSVFSEDEDGVDGKKDADIVITATRTEENSLVAPNFVTTITSEQIAESGKTSVPEIVAAQAGVAIYDLGPKGSFEMLWLRGASPKRVLVLIDGVPTNNIYDGQISLSLIPPGIIERIEIVQGGMSILYGSYAVGGVINIITKKGKELDTFFSGSLTATSYLPQQYTDGGSTLPPQAAALCDGIDTALSVGHNFGAFSFFLSGDLDWARNEYYYTGGGTTAQRDNAGLLGGNAYGSLSFPWETGSCTIAGIYTHQDIGVPGDLSWLTPKASETDERIQAFASLHETNFFTDLLSLDVKLSLTQQYRLNADPTLPPPWGDEDSKVTSFFGEISQKAKMTESLSFIYGGSFGLDYVTGNNFGEQSRTSGSIFLSAPVTAAEALHIYPTLRLDLDSDFGAEFCFGLGMSLLLTDISSIKLSLAKSFRAPNFSELYYPGWSNPNLQPERGWHADIGFTLETQKVKVESSLFSRFMTDEIISVAGIPQNIAMSFYPGCEVQSTIEVIDRFFTEASYTFIYSFDLSDGKTLADDKRVKGVPLHQLHLYLSYKTDETVIRLGVDVMSEYADTWTAKTLPARAILNANFRQKLASSLTLKLALENILNTQYMVADGYPMPGITMRWGLEITL